MPSRPTYCLPSTRSSHNTPDGFDSERRHTHRGILDEQAAYRKDLRLLMRTLRTLAALSVVWIVGYFLLTVTGALSGAPFLLPWAVYAEVAPLGAELGFVVGILALMATASRRHVAWFALFALLVALLHLLPLVIFKTPATFLTVFQVPVVLFAQGAWVVLLPALLPGIAYVYTLIVADGTPLVASVTSNRAA